VLEDLIEAFAPRRSASTRTWAFGPGTTLLLDVSAVPPEDLGLLLRLRAAVPGLEVCWTAGAVDTMRLAGLVDAADRSLPWPLDVTSLPGVRGGSPESAAPREIERRTGLRDDDTHTKGAPAAEAHPAPTWGEARPTEGPLGSHRAARAPGRDLDPDLAHIEAILGGTRPRPRSSVRPASRSPWVDLDFDSLDPSDDAPGFSVGRVAGTPTATSSTRPHTRPNLPSVSGATDPFQEHGHGELVDFEEDGAALDEFQALAGLGPLLTTEELEAFTALDPPDPAPRAELFTRPAALSSDRARALEQPPSARMERGWPHMPRWYRRQIADLADLVQRSELALHGAELATRSADPKSLENDSDYDGGLAPVRAELARLRQFARTLGCLAAPPGAGETVIDLGVLVEELLASLATSAESGAGASPSGRPRFLFRAEPGLEVRADKALLVAALDAVVQVAAAAGSPNDVVRTEVVRTDAGVIEVHIDLPQGRLAGLDPVAVLEPYSLERRLPGIGPNALAAAGGILVGHGGDLSLERRAPDRFIFGLRLPSAHPRGADGS